MAKRNIVRIDQDKCNGCGQCATACAEGAIEIVDGKARLVSETYCDGLGACLGECPQDAITIEQRQADAFDPAAVEKHLKASGQAGVGAAAAAAPAAGHGSAGHVCPGSMARQMRRPQKAGGTPAGAARESALQNWPVQLSLISPMATYFQDADLLIAADCVPFALADFHDRLLSGRALAIGCPKLDQVQEYVEKLTVLLAKNDIKSITVAHMEVPCCRGLLRAVEQAVQASGKKIPVRGVIVGVDGSIKQLG